MLAVTQEASVETVNLAPDVPLLVRPSERLWGASAILPQTLIPAGELGIWQCTISYSQSRTYQPL